MTRARRVAAGAGRSMDSDPITVDPLRAVELMIQDGAPRDEILPVLERVVHLSHLEAQMLRDWQP